VIAENRRFIDKDEPDVLGSSRSATTFRSQLSRQNTNKDDEGRLNELTNSHPQENYTLDDDSDDSDVSNKSQFESFLLDMIADTKKRMKKSKK